MWKAYTEVQRELQRSSRSSKVPATLFFAEGDFLQSSKWLRGRRTTASGGEPAGYGSPADFSTARSELRQPGQKRPTEPLLTSTVTDSHAAQALPGPGAAVAKALTIRSLLRRGRRPGEVALGDELGQYARRGSKIARRAFLIRSVPSAFPFLSCSFASSLPFPPRPPLHSTLGAALKSFVMVDLSLPFQRGTLAVSRPEGHRATLSLPVEH